MVEGTSRTPILQTRGVSKHFGSVVALEQVDFELYPNEIMALVGDNGAGKSTLIKVLSGAYQPDEGEILMDGQHVVFHSPMDARRQGIETVYQDLALAAALDIASNLFLGREERRRGPLGSLLRSLDKPRMRQEAAEHMASLKSGCAPCGRPWRRSRAASARAWRWPGRFPGASVS